MGNELQNTNHLVTCKAYLCCQLNNIPSSTNCYYILVRSNAPIINGERGDWGSEQN